MANGKPLWARLGCLALVLLVLTAPGLADHGFSYEAQDEWSFVSGQMQSPIDISPADVQAAQTPISLSVDPAAKATYVDDNGHTVEVGLSGQSTLDGRPFDMVQLHFHAPSEHTIGGEHAPMELHIVHKSQAGRLAVVGVLLAQGADNAAFGQVLDAVVPGERTQMDGDLDLSALLPATLSAYHYLGSLTTPPLTENVEWYVLGTPVEISAVQLAAFHTLYDGNNRSIQPLHGRVILHWAP